MAWVSRFNAARRLLDPLKSENSTVRVPGTSIGPRKASVERAVGARDLVRRSTLGRHRHQHPRIGIGGGRRVVADGVVVAPGEGVAGAGIADRHRRAAGERHLHDSGAIQEPEPAAVRGKEGLTARRAPATGTASSLSAVRSIRPTREV